MPPKKGKKVEEEPPPQPEELLPPGYSLGCQVYWAAVPQRLSGGIVRAGAAGVLESLPELTVTENEEGEKSYSLDCLMIKFDGQPEAVEVPVKDKLLELTPPSPSVIWNLQPMVMRRQIVVPALFEPLGPTAAKKDNTRVMSPRSAATRAHQPWDPQRLSSPGAGRRSTLSYTTEERVASPSAAAAAKRQSMRNLSSSSSDLVERSRAASAFIDALFTLEAHPCRSDKVKHVLSPELAAFLDDPEFQYSCTSLGGHAQPGRIDWRAIYPWIEKDVLKAASEKAGLSPALSIDEDRYLSIIKRFDKTVGAFICNVPLSENILPFAKFVVSVLYLEAQEELRKEAERVDQIKVLLESECAQEGNPRISLLWDTDDLLELSVVLPEGCGEINARESCTDDGEAIGVLCDDISRPVDSVSWPDFDPEAIGVAAVASPPPGEYTVRIRMVERRSHKPCHWAYQVGVGGHVDTFCGTWAATQNEEVTVFAFAAPGSN